MPQRHPKTDHIKGFTLIELAIVLVVIGLIVGAIFVGRDLTVLSGILYAPAEGSMGDSIRGNPLGLTPEDRILVPELRG